MKGALFAGAVFLVSIATAQAPQPQHPLDVPYVPTENNVVRAMLKLAGIRGSDTVFDLGCGDGRIVILAAREYKAHGVGIDLNPQRIQEARENAKRNRVESLVRFEENDLFEADIHEATVVTIYLLPEVNLRLRPKLLRDLKPGARIVSHSFDMGDWKPEKQEQVDGQWIYLWIVPPKKP
jgi:cyclopropane fatty-acyl-phospholipid synthase-like methyltransferase